MLRIWSKYAEMLEKSVDDLFSSPTWPGIYESLDRVPTVGTEARKIWEERWPELFILVNDREVTQNKLNDPDSLVVTSHNVIKNNYCFSDEVIENIISSEHATKFSEVENNVSFNYDDESAPEIFVNPAYGDYSLREDCMLEFVNGYDFSKIGRY